MTKLLGVCPYYRMERGKFMYCEAIRFIFPDNIVRRNILYRFCADVNNGYENCFMKKEMDLYYERVQKDEQNTAVKKTKENIAVTE